MSAPQPPTSPLVSVPRQALEEQTGDAFLPEYVQGLVDDGQKCKTLLMQELHRARSEGPRRQVLDFEHRCAISPADDWEHVMAAWPRHVLADLRKGGSTKSA